MENLNCRSDGGQGRAVGESEREFKHLDWRSEDSEEAWSGLVVSLKKKKNHAPLIVKFFGACIQYKSFNILTPFPWSFLCIPILEITGIKKNGVRGG